MENRLRKKAERTEQQIEAYKAKFGESSILEIDENGGVAALVGFTDNGRPIFYATDNDDAGATINTDKVYPGGVGGYSLTGNGINIGEWDGGEVRGTHFELVNRVTQVDTPSALSNHATHVAGTMIATGLNPQVKGMAYQANISAYDFFNDDPEIAAYAQGASTILSNHSYGTITGWYYSSSAGMYQFWGDTALSQNEDYRFGFYNNGAQTWDAIAHLSPNYLIVKSAGNDRNDTGPTPGDTHQVWSNVLNTWVTSTAIRAADCPTGYDCISTSGNAKNILTVGAVSSILLGYTQPSDVQMSSFSGWGPTDDGRIKPDIVGVGVGVISTGSQHDSAFYGSNGTSMSAPNVTGSLALVQQHHQNETGGFMRSSALKALVIHTAMEAGSNPGPDYSYGWGLMNTLAAVDFISDSVSSFMTSDTLVNGDSLEYSFYYDGFSPLQATICWTDPAGTPVAPALDPTTSMLVNDLDLRATNMTTTAQYSPWVLDPANPSSAATQGDNFRDNVENIKVSTPVAGMYTFKIKHKGTLNSPQVVSVAISGFTQAPANSLPVAGFTTSDSLICVGDSVTFTDTTTNAPTSWSWWVTNGATTDTSSAQNPTFIFNTPGVYTVGLVAANSIGLDSLVKLNHIVVDSLPNLLFDFLTDVCHDSGLISLNAYASPSGGVYTGPGVTGTDFDPIAAGLGTHVLTYTYTTPGGCVVSIQDTTIVEPGVTTSHPQIPPVCLGSAPIPLLGGTPAGGTYSGIGVVNNTFVPDSAGLGVHTIVYEYTNAGGCSDTTQIQIAVLSGVTASLSNLPDACLSAGVVTLSGGTPAGGAYTGVGVDTINGAFNPALAGVGTHVISYTASSGICVSTDTALITVLPNPSVSLNLGFGSVCTGASPVTLTGGMPMGGVYAGPGVTGTTFDPSTAGIGSHDISYTYTDSSGCVASDTNTIQVTGSVSVSLSDSSGICSSASPFMLNLGTPVGGTYTGVGISNNMFDPAITGPGVFSVYYTYDTNGCTGADSALLTVVQAPQVVFSPLAPVCVNDDTVSLIALPLGGTFTGPGVVNGMFVPNLAGLGVHTIDYVVQDSLGCSGAASQTIEVTTGVASIQGLDSVYCESDPAVTVSVAPAGGVLIGPGVSGSDFIPVLAGSGSHTISYVTTGGCADTASLTVQVNQAPVANPIMGSGIANPNATFTYMVQPVSGLTVQWSVIGGSIVSTNNNVVQVLWGNGSSGVLTATQYYVSGCADSAQLQVQLRPVGTEESAKAGYVKVYPNPVSDILRVRSVKEADLTKIVVVNQNGAEVLRSGVAGGREVDLDVSTLAPGIYWLNVELSTNERILVDFVVN